MFKKGDIVSFARSSDRCDCRHYAIIDSITEESGKYVIQCIAYFFKVNMTGANVMCITEIVDDAISIRHCTYDEVLSFKSRLISMDTQESNDIVKKYIDKKKTKIEKFREITDQMADLYERKNHDYGDSFGETFRKLGPVSAITRITDKYNRIVSLTTKGEQKVDGEAIEDTLIDLANYAIMTVMEMRESNQKP